MPNQDDDRCVGRRPIPTPGAPMVVLVSVVVAFATACTGTGPATNDASLLPRAPLPAADRPFELTQWTETFVDTTRPTEPQTSRAASPERSLPTAIYLPDGSGALPLVVFSHGLGGHPDKFTELLSAWSRAGYVIAAPAFPLTNNRVPDASSNWTDVSNQPADVSFVITEMLRLNRDPSSRVRGRIDPDRIGAGGLSLGGATTYAVAFNGCCRDARVKAVEVLAGAMLVGGKHELDGHVPLLMVHGDKDASLPYQLATDVYRQATAAVWFVTLVGGSHAPPFEDSETPYDAMVERLTTDFWDAALGTEPDAFRRFEQDAVVPGSSTLQQRGAVGR